jgi:hypothetical protein
VCDTAPVTIAYLAHPVGERDLPDDAVQYGDNMAGAHDWISFLSAVARDLVIECSWVAMNTALSPRFYGGKLVTSAHEILQVCGLLVLVGGRISPHMRHLLSWAATFRVPVLDLTDIGTHPPWRELDRFRADIGRRLAHLGL